MYYADSERNWRARASVASTVRHAGLLRRLRVARVQFDELKRRHADRLQCQRRHRSRQRRSPPVPPRRRRRFAAGIQVQLVYEKKRSLN